MNVGVLVGAVLVVAALAVTAVAVGRRARRRLPNGAAPVDLDLPAPVPAPGRLREGAGGVYAPAFIVESGHCFRLCRDTVTGVASPCDRPVEGKGEFVDHRGNVVEVEACGTHMIDLGKWRFHPVEGAGGAMSG